ncbi:VRR-NUC domain-containing protein [Porphyromonas cangingivalis]|uniref:VRR-NUC domain-containing protein n=1 Tax=Porphyromonas cangingivalis TaxID=36874 RepID=UPI002430A913|nr:VRR-NUC domain-containing protein [Porphyromonas cangingivalis]
MNEKLLEKKLNLLVEKTGGLSIKFESRLLAGMPDRLVLYPGGQTYWVELKTTGQKPRAIQKYRHEQLRQMGQEVFIIDSIDSLNEFIDYATEK